MPIYSVWTNQVIEARKSIANGKVWGDRVLNIISSRQVKNNQSLIDLLFNQEQKKNCFYDKNKNAEKSENLLSVIQISGERISFYEQNKKIQTRC